MITAMSLSMFEDRPVFVYCFGKRFLGPTVENRLIEIVAQSNPALLREVALGLKSGSEARSELCSLADQLEEVATALT